MNTTPINKLASYEEVEFPIEETSQIPSYIKMNSDVNNPRFIADGMNEFERNIKRIGDFLLSGISLIIFSPLFVICYILVKREDGGPAIFKQERIGRFGRPFYIYKFRSMRVDAEKNGPQLFGTVFKHSFKFDYLFFSCHCFVFLSFVCRQCYGRHLLRRGLMFICDARISRIYLAFFSQLSGRCPIKCEKEVNFGAF